jgi:hypothetical protein
MGDAGSVRLQLECSGQLEPSLFVDLGWMISAKHFTSLLVVPANLRFGGCDRVPAFLPSYEYLCWFAGRFLA